jgi:uncharacterized membrane protein YuzA (DUF378 family)
MTKLNWLDWTAFTLLIIGGLNWGLIGLFGFNLVEIIFGAATFGRIIYTLVGLSALYSIYSLSKISSTTARMEAPSEEDRMRRAA